MYTAKLYKQYRHIEYTLPRVLLKDICINTEVFRDHTWVLCNKRLNELLDSLKGGEWILISFNAKVFDYPSTEGGTKKGLKKLRRIRPT